MLLCRPGNILTTGWKGHSQAKVNMPNMMLMICRTGKGLTAPSRFFVRKSQKILGQKKPSIEAATWYEAAVRTMSRAQWFLMSLPMVLRKGPEGDGWLTDSRKTNNWKGESESRR